MEESVQSVAATAQQLCGAGKAYLSVAQSTAITIQDAADNLRNICTISTTALGVAMAQLLETGDPVYIEAIDKAQAMARESADTYKLICSTAAEVLRSFPVTDNTGAFQKNAQ